LMTRISTAFDNRCRPDRHCIMPTASTAGNCLRLVQESRQPFASLKVFVFLACIAAFE
jgi:hypothetical protein